MDLLAAINSYLEKLKQFLQEVKRGQAENDIFLNVGLHPMDKVVDVALNEWT